MIKAELEKKSFDAKVLYETLANGFQVYHTKEVVLKSDANLAIDQIVKEIDKMIKGNEWEKKFLSNDSAITYDELQNAIDVLIEVRNKITGE